MLRCKKLLPAAVAAFINPSPFAVASPTTDLGSGLPADATSTSRGDRGVNELGGASALAAEDRSVLNFSTKVRAVWRAPFSAALTGAGVGLGLGAIFLTAGMAGHAADHAHELRMAEAASSGYAASYAEGATGGRGLYALRGGSDAQTVAIRFGADRGAVQARRRADLDCLTEAVYFEARGESTRGQAAVAQVVMNRVKHPAFPKSVCAVVFQGAGHSGCQFSFACDGSMKKRREGLAWDRARDIAGRALSGVLRAEIGSATHFHTTAVSPAWAPQMLRVANVGTHVFYRFSPYRLRTPSADRPMVEHAVLTAGNGSDIPELRLMPAMVEKAVSESLEPTPAGIATATLPANPTPQPPKPVTTPATAKPAEAALLTAPQPIVAATS
ncbi:MAG TPA: cell wall hydrolase [Phenylobacterium sp.]